jgi:hypothetical protein
MLLPSMYSIYRNRHTAGGVCVVEQQNTKPLFQLIKKRKKVDKQLLRAFRSGDLERVPELNARLRKLTLEIEELLPPATDP